MPRQNIQRPALEKYQRQLASMIDTALKLGQNHEGQDRGHWTNAAFATAAKCSENAVANWRNPDKRQPPENIELILGAFFGRNPRYVNDRNRMKHAWQLARGYREDELPEDGRIGPSMARNLQGEVTLVHLRAHDLEDNPLSNRNVDLHISLTISPDANAGYDDNGRYHNQPVTIGLKDAILAVRSRHWQPALRGLISERGHKNFKVHAAGAQIIGPLDPKLGMLDGEPVPDQPIAELEPIDGGKGPLTVAILASHGSFKVDSPGMETRTQDAVVQALLMEQLKTRDQQHRVELASVTLHPKPV